MYRFPAPQAHCKPAPRDREARISARIVEAVLRGLVNGAQRRHTARKKKGYGRHTGSRNLVRGREAAARRRHRGHCSYHGVAIRLRAGAAGSQQIYACSRQPFVRGAFVAEKGSRLSCCCPQPSHAARRWCASAVRSPFLLCSYRFPEERN